MQGTVSLRSVHGKYLSAQPDGRAEWNRDHASTWEYFQVEQRHNGKIALKGAHGMYLSAQLDGSVQINRDAAPPGGWEEFTVEDRGNNVVCLKSCHGKYLSAQQNGTAQWNRDHAPRGGWEDIQFVQQGATGQQQPATTTASMPSYVIVAQAGSSEVNGNYEFVPGKHENRHWGTIAGHYQHTQNPEIFIAFQDCGTNHQRPEWNKWMIISKVGVLYAAHTGGKIGVPPREGVWENVDWDHPGAPGGKHPAPTVYHPPENAAKTQDPAPTVYHPPENAAKTQERAPARWQEPIEILEAVPDKPVRFKINNRPSSNDAWVGIYPLNAPDQDHGEENKRWKWLRNLDANNASFPKQAVGDWSIRVFSDGGYTLHERKDFQVKAQTVAPQPLDETAEKPGRGRKDFQVKAQTVAPQPLDETAEKPGRGRIRFVALLGIFLMLPGLPLLIVGSVSVGEDNLAMIIPGAILTGVGGFLAVGAWFTLISSWLKSGKTSPRWTKFAAVFAVLLLIPGVTLLVIGSISAESFVAQSESNATLEIFDVDDMGDQGFIIFIEAVLGDFDNNGIYDHCENIIVSATHSGSWMSDPWTGYQKVNPPDESRQVFELGECESGDHVEQKHKDGRNIIKMGQACYGCMKGTTTISAEYSDGSKATVMWIQDGEEVIGAIGMIIGGSIMTGVSSIALISLLMIWGGSRHRKQDGSQKSSIDILEATTNKGVYFRINNPPTSNDAWVGIYPRGGEDSDHGEEGVRWHWLRDIDVNKARFYEKSEGRWSIRVFSDSGYTLDSQDDFEILPKNDQWWKN